MWKVGYSRTSGAFLRQLLFPTRPRQAGSRSPASVATRRDVYASLPGKLRYAEMPQEAVKAGMGIVPPSGGVDNGDDSCFQVWMSLGDVSNDRSEGFYGLAFIPACGRLIRRIPG